MLGVRGYVECSRENLTRGYALPGTAGSSSRGSGDAGVALLVRREVRLRGCRVPRELVVRKERLRPVIDGCQAPLTDATVNFGLGDSEDFGGLAELLTSDSLVG